MITVYKVRSRNLWKQNDTNHVRVYLVRLWGGRRLWGRRWIWLPVGILWWGLVALIGRVRSRNHRPGRLDRGCRVRGRHSMSYSWGLLDTVSDCRGVGVCSGGLSAGKKKRERGYLYIQCRILGPGFTWKKTIESNVEKICVAALINELTSFLKKNKKQWKWNFCSTVPESSVILFSTETILFQNIN